MRYVVRYTSPTTAMNSYKAFNYRHDAYEFMKSQEATTIGRPSLYLETTEEEIALRDI